VEATSPSGPLTVTILGSGGAQPGRRAPASYLVRSGSDLVLLDAGASALARLVEVDVSPRDLSLVALSHGHIDHSGGLAAVVFGAWMDGRGRALPVAGPEGNDDDPGIHELLDLLFGPSGAWRYLRHFEGFGLEPLVAGVGGSEPALVWSTDTTEVRAVRVPHGSMPAVAYRVDGPGGSLCFTGDISGTDDGLVALAQGADILIHDQAIARRADDPKGNHPVPEDTAANAARAGVAHLVLSHLTSDSEAHLEDVRARVVRAFPGRVTVAEDLQTISLAAS
jgi:ribonuclease BN (tRNA processing enzyme)